MHDNIPWQIYADNGEPILGKSAQPTDLDDDWESIRAAAHIWIWRSKGDSYEVLLQKRAVHVRHGGKYDISAAGHVDVGETVLRAAVRECKEEIGLDVDPSKLRFSFVHRKNHTVQSFNFVYLYEVDGSQDFVLEDGEVERLDWVDAVQFQEYANDPAAYGVVNHRQAYFVPLLDALEAARRRGPKVSHEDHQS